ncbi:MAG: hypothetical protein PVG71_08965, partial [Anaerolineae bacterium]
MNHRFVIHIGLALTLAGLLVLGMLGTLRALAPSRPGNITHDVWEATDGGAETGVLVVLEEQAD